MQHYDVIIIGGGQSGLSTAYYLRRMGLSYILLDGQEKAGGSWVHTWNSLNLFSPAEHSSLPGWFMPKGNQPYPTKKETVDYLSQYELRYKLPIKRPVKVLAVHKKNDRFILFTSQTTYTATTIVSATGTWGTPHLPKYPGIHLFKGIQLHSAQYSSSTPMAGKKVLIVGGGNSAAQILAEVSESAKTTWVTQTDPKFLPDEVDGRYLFEFATKQYKAKLEGKTITPTGSLGDIVMVKSVRQARDRGVLKSYRPFKELYESGVIWENKKKSIFDFIVWCTGFNPTLDHLKPLGVVQENGKVATKNTQSLLIPGLWLVGYGSWTGYASATLIGVGRTARQTVQEIVLYLKNQK